MPRDSVMVLNETLKEILEELKAMNYNTGLLAERMLVKAAAENSAKVPQKSVAKKK